MKIVISELTKQNPLIWPSQRDIVVDTNKLNIFLGGGVATKSKISQAAPFDLLGFMLTAEQIKRQTGGEVHLLIADQHAWLANNLDRNKIVHSANNLALTINNIISTFRLTNWHIHLASKMFPNQLPTDYETLETRDIAHFATLFDCGVKLGWTFSLKETGKTDESHFDELHTLPTVLIKPGLTNDPVKPHESPYICTDPSMRITFGNSNNWDISPAVKNHLRNICLLFEKLIDPFPPKTPLEKKITQIINTIVE